jgi:hypothetical protein
MLDLRTITQVKVFDEAVSVAPGMAEQDERAPTIPMVVKLPRRLVLTAFLMAFLPKCEDKYY